MTAIPDTSESCPCEGRDPVRRSRIYKGVRIANAGPLPSQGHVNLKQNRRGAPETNRRRGAPRGNRNALKSGRYTAEAKKERRRNRLLLRQLRAGLEYARSVIRARDAAARLAIISLPATILRKKFQKSKNNSRRPALSPGGSFRIARAWPVRPAPGGRFRPVIRRAGGP
jgi:hypothetical protein